MFMLREEKGTFLLLLNDFDLCLPILEGDKQPPPKQVAAQVSGRGPGMEAKFPRPPVQVLLVGQGTVSERCLCPGPVRCWMPPRAVEVIGGERLRQR